MRKLFLTFFYTGLSPIAPGTIGSIFGAVVAVILINFLGTNAQTTLILLAILITIFSIKEINIYEKQNKKSDPKEIVIDEVVGVFIAFAISSNTYSQMILSLIFFRLFDIWKPSIIGKVDRELKGGLGVMIDDVIAGIFGGICSILVYTSYLYLVNLKL